MNKKKKKIRFRRFIWANIGFRCWFMEKEDEEKKRRYPDSKNDKTCLGTVNK